MERRREREISGVVAWCLVFLASSSCASNGSTFFFLSLYFRMLVCLKKTRGSEEGWR